ncbi:MAG: AAA family ATPase [Syntrophobacteraceae bacterium]
MIDNGRLLRLRDTLNKAKEELAKVIIGQSHAVDLALTAVLTGQHVLVEGVPGVAKTLLVRTLAHVFSGGFSRIQFTPDLMPADITGTHIFNMKVSEFVLAKGPIFTNFLLADEINRAPAKTQSALLQGMQEKAVTIDRKTYGLPPDFIVFATQNPVEFEGTYPLPEAQKDRFMIKIPMRGPEREEELTLAQRMLGSDTPEQTLARGAVGQVISAAEMAELKSCLTEITFREELVGYVLDIVRATRSHHAVFLGAGPRATQGLLLAARAYAAVSGRDFVTPDDIKYLASPVLEHRLILRPEYEIQGMLVSEVIESLLKEIAVPR